MTTKKECNSESNSFVAAAEQVRLQPVLEHRQRRGRRNIAWWAIPHLCCTRTRTGRRPGSSGIWTYTLGGSVAEWLACWTQAQKVRVQIAAANLRQTVHTRRGSVHQAAKFVAALALLRVAEVTAGLAESNGSLPPGLWLTSPAGWLPRTGISSGTLRSAVEYGLPLPLPNRLSHLWVVVKYFFTDDRS